MNNEDSYRISHNVIASADAHVTDTVISQNSMCTESQNIPVPPGNVQRCTSHRSEPLTMDRISEFMDEDGRLVDEHALRKAVFLGI